MKRVIRSAAVLGAGAMGAQIAAHLANAGVVVRLLDVTETAARAGLDRAIRLRPDPFFTSDGKNLITIGGFDEMASLVVDVDWIVEAVAEQLDVKRSLLARVDACRAPHAIVSSNTSGLSLAAIASDLSPDFRRHWLGTHFFNPPRYLRLVEIIPTADTDPAITADLSRFIDYHLGKGVVMARDAPAFIANHLGVYGVVRLLESAASGTFTIEEIDAITGVAIGRPKSATFRTIDLAGLDILAHVATDLATRLPNDDDRRQFLLPAFVAHMLDRGLLGDKTGQGFYKKVKTTGGGTEILTLDLGSFEYREARPPVLPALGAVTGIDDVGARIRTLFEDTGRVGDLLRGTLGPMLRYAARAWPLMAHSIDDVDRAMRWGFGWELGPFETIDAIGASGGLGALGGFGASGGLGAPGAPGAKTAVDGPETRARKGPLPPAQPDFQILAMARANRGVVETRPGASLIDLGDGVLGVEFHSKMNTIGADAIAMLHAGVALASANFQALVIGNDGPLFSAGADLLLLLRAAQAKQWTEVDRMVREFQAATMALKYADVPVVVAPGGLTLGGGCEICLHGDRVQAAAETYMGLVEVGVGLVPAGGGTKEMLLRAMSATGHGDRAKAVQRAFETIGFGKTSASGPEARLLGYTRDVDGITMNRDRLIADAKAVALARGRNGYLPRVARTEIPVGGDGAYATLSLGVHLASRAGRISDHDALIGRTLARVLTGGDIAHPTTVSESYLLDLEREAFLRLCGEQKTLDRIVHTLTTGKTLRN
jgi:3-hydroxyacyl-CoA dehydrogenase